MDNRVEEMVKKIDESIKSLRNIADMLWEEGFYARSIRSDTAADLLEEIKSKIISN